MTSPALNNRSSRKRVANELPDWIRSARQQWRWQGQVRPPFAATPGPGQTSVADFARPPRLAQDTREVVVRWGDVEVARTRRAVLVLETAHPPSVYLPWDDVVRRLLQSTADSSFCNGKDQRSTGPWCMPIAACPAQHGATRSRWPEPMLWPISWRSVRRRSIAG